MKAGVEKSDGKGYSELEICRAIKIGREASKKLSFKADPKAQMDRETGEADVACHSNGRGKELLQ